MQKCKTAVDITWHIKKTIQEWRIINLQTEFKACVDEHHTVSLYISSDNIKSILKTSLKRKRTHTLLSLLRHRIYATTFKPNIKWFISRWWIQQPKSKRKPCAWKKSCFALRQLSSLSWFWLTAIRFDILQFGVGHQWVNWPDHYLSFQVGPHPQGGPSWPGFAMKTLKWSRSGAEVHRNMAAAYTAAPAASSSKHTATSGFL